MINKLSDCIVAAKQANELYKMPFDILERMNESENDKYIYAPFNTQANGYKLVAIVESSGMITIF